MCSTNVFGNPSDELKRYGEMVRSCPLSTAAMLQAKTHYEDKLKKNKDNIQSYIDIILKEQSYINDMIDLVKGESIPAHYSYSDAPGAEILELSSKDKFEKWHLKTKDSANLSPKRVDVYKHLLKQLALSMSIILSIDDKFCNSCRLSKEPNLQEFMKEAPITAAKKIKVQYERLSQICHESWINIINVVGCHIVEVLKTNSKEEVDLKMMLTKAGIIVKMLDSNIPLMCDDAVGVKTRESVASDWVVLLGLIQTIGYSTFDMLEGIARGGKRAAFAGVVNSLFG